MKNTTVKIDEIAALAKLSLNKAESEKFEDELSRFADFAQILREYKPQTHVLDKSNDGLEILREDASASKRASNARALVGEDRVHDGYVCVPLTVEESK